MQGQPYTKVAETALQTLVQVRILLGGYIDYPAIRQNNLERQNYGDVIMHDLVELTS
jgi:hypothetical protein